MLKSLFSKAAGLKKKLQQANQWTGFYVVGISIMKQLTINDYWEGPISHMWVKPIDSIVTKTNCFEFFIHIFDTARPFLKFYWYHTNSPIQKNGRILWESSGKITNAWCLGNLNVFNISRTASSVVDFSWNFVVVSKSLKNLFTELIPYLLKWLKSSCSSLSALLVKVLKIWNRIWVIFKGALSRFLFLFLFIFFFLRQSAS